MSLTSLGVSAASSEVYAGSRNGGASRRAVTTEASCAVLGFGDQPHAAPGERTWRVSIDRDS
jgi:hypothetical protein